MYAKASIVHMLSGHAYARALRDRILTSAALISVLIDTPDSWTQRSIEDDSHISSKTRTGCNCSS